MATFTFNGISSDTYGLKIIERVVNRYRGNMDYYYSEECHEFHMIIAMKDPRM